MKGMKPEVAVKEEKDAQEGKHLPGNPSPGFQDHHKGEYAKPDLVGLNLGSPSGDLVEEEYYVPRPHTGHRRQDPVKPGDLGLVLALSARVEQKHGHDGEGEVDGAMDRCGQKSDPCGIEVEKGHGDQPGGHEHLRETYGPTKAALDVVLLDYALEVFLLDLLH